jgi:hypothetical protein
VVADAADLRKVSPRTGLTTRVTTFRQTGKPRSPPPSHGCRTISGIAALHVRPDRLKIRSIIYRPRAGGALVTVDAVDSTSRPVSRAVISVFVRSDGRRTYAATGAAGKATFRRPCATVAVQTTIEESPPPASSGWPHSRQSLLPPLVVASQSDTGVASDSSRADGPRRCGDAKQVAVQLCRATWLLENVLSRLVLNVTMTGATAMQRWPCSRSRRLCLLRARSMSTASARPQQVEIAGTVGTEIAFVRVDRTAALPRTATKLATFSS